MDQCHAVGGMATLTNGGFRDATTVDLHPGCVGTHLALEESLLHLWNQLGCSDYHATDGDKLVDVCKELGREISMSISHCPPPSQMRSLPWAIILPGQVWVCCEAQENPTGRCRGTWRWLGSQTGAVAGKQMAWDALPVFSSFSTLMDLWLSALGLPLQQASTLVVCLLFWSTFWFWIRFILLLPLHHDLPSHSLYHGEVLLSLWMWKAQALEPDDQDWRPVWPWGYP